MTLRKLEVVPKELLVQFDGASCLVRPQVEYLRKNANEMPVLARQDGFEQLYTDDLIPIWKGLKAGKDRDGYSLSEKQPLVQAKKLSEDTMIDILRKFWNEILHEYVIWTELLDWQPEKRIEGYEIQKGYNAVLYRNWSWSKLYNKRGY